LVPGFVVASQTCDLLKSCLEWPYVQLGALQEVPEVFEKAARGPEIFEKAARGPEIFEKQVRKGMRPAFASVPALANRPCSQP
jgi:hypothetical protein